MLRKLRLGTQFTLLLTLIFLGGTILSGITLSRAMQHKAEDEVSTKAEILTQTMNAVRSYTSEHVAPLLQKQLETSPKFISETVPAYAALEVFENFRSQPEHRNYIYREATLIPRSYRLDLDQKAGEIAWVGVNHITVYSMLEDRELRGSELEERWIPLQDNAYILPPEEQANDPVQRDIQDIPKVLKSIEQSWRDPVSFNRQTADYLVELLIEKAKLWDHRQRATVNFKLEQVADIAAIDLLITGVESSLWLGERFAQDLTLLFPSLSVKTISANQLLQRLQYDWKGLRLGKTSIVLAISQSGQTFPTLQATNALEELRRQGSISELFIMTGEICSLMGTAIAQLLEQPQVAN
ncbi:c-type heme family protein [Myxacorys almedinensis]|uniref:c-type heme family protein n=1 Tax=Myxacorys almedinensis TaxID=2651157 RepID=UPI001EE425D9|nr:DUF3365 domain-containing protein [Myxacorys almedinensis]